MLPTYILVSEEIFIKNHIWKMSELTDAHARAHLAEKQCSRPFFQSTKFQFNLFFSSNQSSIFHPFKALVFPYETCKNIYIRI